mmetsp:Transcript_14808/g.24097  ORF Transcript_14808/g.24097 Transcript_14808/m.24097 type:complete len:223 (-) Transcript_14808:3646-4314(-)
MTLCHAKKNGMFPCKLSFGDLEKEIALAETVATPVVVNKLKTDYDATLHKPHPSKHIKFQYGYVLCCSSSRGLMRRGIELLTELHERIRHDFDTVNVRSKSIGEIQDLDEDEYVILNQEETKQGEEDLDSDAGFSEDEEMKQNDATYLSQQCLYYIGVGRYRLGDYRQAITVCDQLIQANIEHSRAHSLRDLCIYSLFCRGALSVVVSLGVVIPAYFWHKSK